MKTGRKTNVPDRRSLLKSIVAGLTVASSTPVRAASDGPLEVVATFSILGDMVSRIGGEHIELTTLVGPNGDAHVYQPVPSDARTVSEAKVLFVNGMAFESWLNRLVEASNFTGTRVVATTGVVPLAFEDKEEHRDDDRDEGHAAHGSDEHVNHKDDDHDDQADHKGDAP